jgi:hypothetical protein
MAKITDNSNELSFHQLTSTSSVLLIPLFQRPYVWTPKQLDRMISEIESITNEEDTSRFLGAIIAVTRPTNPAEPTPHEIVDGQQRLTTLYLFLLAAAHVAAREGQTEYARGLISTNLIVDWAQELPVNTKLQPSIADRGQFREIFNRVSGAGSLSDWLPQKARLPGSTGNESGALLRQYSRILKHLIKKTAENSFESLENIVEAVRHSMTFVFILLKDPGSATTVFEGLNDPGVPISVGDLVKNEVFSRVGYNEPQAMLLHDNIWIPFRNRFGESFDEYFFPFSVIHKPTTSRTEMFSELREQWSSLGAEAIIRELEEFSTSFLVMRGKLDATETYGKEVGECVQRLVKLGWPAAVYPFVMRLLKEFSDNKITKEAVVGSLVTLESFLVRRALCGIEPTGLLGLFRTMWTNAEGHPTAERVRAIILKRLTVEWPTGHRLREAITSRPLYGSAIAKFVVLEYDRSQGIDHPIDSDVSIEHVMPQTYCDNWSDVVTKAQHIKLRHLWGNLIPLSMEMNSLVNQDKYEAKRKLFEEESMFSSARQLATNYDTWGEDEINARSEVLAAWSIQRWNRPEEPVSE